jgi:flagellar motor component MotA
MKYELNSPAKPLGLLRKLAALVVTVALVGFALMFSAVLLVIIVVVGTIAGAFLWWKTRELRKQLRNFTPRKAVRETKMSGDEVFEGEVIRVVDSRNER